MFTLTADFLHRPSTCDMFIKPRDGEGVTAASTTHKKSLNGTTSGDRPRNTREGDIHSQNWFYYCSSGTNFNAGHQPGHTKPPTSALPSTTFFLLRNLDKTADASSVWKWGIANSSYKLGRSDDDVHTLQVTLINITHASWRCICKLLSQHISCYTSYSQLTDSNCI